MSESDIVQDFLVESQENLDRLDRDLVGLEKNPHDREALAGVFRTIHTIKGTCGFLGFNKLEKVAHVGENLLTRLRDGQLTLNPEITTALLNMVDAIRQMLKKIESSGTDGEGDYLELRETLARWQTAETAGSAALPAASPVSPSPVTPSAIPQAFDPGAGATGAASPAAERNSRSEKAGVAGEASGRAEEAAVPALAVEPRSRDATPETIRVGVNLLDKLMTLVGELVLARNQLLQFANTSEDTGLQAVSQRMNLIATELQEEVMKTRMQPIGNIWAQFPRTVRDVALSCAKQVTIEMEGKETELDKTIIEAIKDPLTHLVRNSVDHGIELPEERRRAGKDPTGRLVLRAFHEGGQVNIEISDDGAGLNGERIRKKAVERGVISAEQAARMPEREIFNLIFLPGFSTAQQVSNVSGRGVGMDVVKTNVEKIGGTVDLQSTAGRGTTVRVKIPLTLAIIPALVVTCAGDRYAIPQVSLLELVRLEADQAGIGIEMVQGAPVYRLRGRLLPLVYLGRELQLAAMSGAQAEQGSAINIVVLQADDRQFGLVVDEINDTEEIVVKPLGKQLKGVNTFAGATIMGDGKVALILDALGLAQRANVISEVHDRAVAEKEHSAAEKSAGNRQTLLLFQTGERGRMAIPLSLVARLEEFARSAVENTGQQQVVQYRGQIMPLISISEVVELPEGGSGQSAGKADSQAPLQVVVYAEQGRSVGLVVERILDIVEEDVVLERPAERAGILGSAVVQQRVTDLLDVKGVIRAANPAFFAKTAAAAAGAGGR
jgi:two-component system chemotaxis sensor kinase CheA